MTDNTSCSDAIQKGRERMKQKWSILVMLIAFMLLLTSCGAGNKVEQSDTVSRFAKANPGGGESIDIPGYESLSLQAGSKSQLRPAISRWQAVRWRTARRFGKVRRYTPAKPLRT